MSVENESDNNLNSPNSLFGEGSFSKVIKTKKVGVNECSTTPNCTGCKECVVAVKKLMWVFCDYDQLERESTIHAKLNHPNIVKFYHVVDHNSMAIEPCFGGTLEQKGNISLHKARKYMRDILAALEYMHDINIAHLDVKPLNCLLGDNDRVKLCDFGSASEMYESGQCTLRSGTPEVSPPETAYEYVTCGSGRCIDVWAAGVTFIYLLLGRYPWKSTRYMNDSYNDWKSEKGEIYTALKKKSSFAFGIIVKMLDKTPCKRPYCWEVLSWLM